tara:strand:+ start:5595 stop:6833 length:1239 start_codon:yes stop_codon:yes gene_type:complete
MNNFIVIIFQSALRLGAGVLVFLSNMYMARYLPQETVGWYFACLSLVAFVSSVAVFGNDKRTLRVLSKVKVYYFHTYYLAVVGKIIMSIMIVVFISLSLYYGFQVPYLSTSLVLLISFSVISLYLSSLLLASENNTQLQIATFLQNLIFLILLFIFNENIKVGSDVILLYAISVGIFVIYSLLVFSGFSYENSNNHNKFAASDFFKGYELFISSLAQSLSAVAPIWIISYFFGDNEIAIYGIIIKSAFVINILISMVDANYSRKFASNLGGKLELQVIVREASRMMFFLAVPIILLMMYISPYYLLMFGESYSQESLILVIYLIGMLVNVCTGNAGYLLLMKGYDKEFRKINIMGLLVYLAFLLALIPFFSALGAVMAFVIYSCVINISSYKCCYQKLGISTFPLSINLQKL